MTMTACFNENPLQSVGLTSSYHHSLHVHRADIAVPLTPFNLISERIQKYRPKHGDAQRIHRECNCCLYLVTQDVCVPIPCRDQG